MNEVIEEIREVLNAPAEFLEPDVESYGVYYDRNCGAYWIPDARSLWTRVNQTSAERYLLVRHDIDTARDGAAFSPMDETMVEIQQRLSVGYAGKLAGYRAGLIEQNGELILVTDSPRLVEPTEGEFSIIRKFLDGLLGDQRVYFECWMKVAVESLGKQLIRSGQALVLAGPKDCGKSVLQNQIITPLLGGRMAKPYQFMSGATPFNGNLFEAEHLMVEDDIASSDIRARRNFGAHIKQFSANEEVQHHAKGKQAMTLKPFWRMSISCNEEPENLAILPPIDDSLMDKMIILKAFRNPMPMPTETPEERAAFQAQIRAELPAYVYHLLRMEIPRELRASRYGVRTFQNPELLKELNEIAPEYRLLELVDQCLFYSSSRSEPGQTSFVRVEEWRGSATELESLLRRPGNDLREQVNKLLYASNTCGNYLTRLADKESNRVKASIVNGARRYTIYRPEST
jgi:hypothetical protein